MIAFTVYGPPVGKERARISKHGGVFTPARTADYEEHVRLTAMAAVRRRPSWPLEGSYTVLLRIYCKNWTRPDTDNVLKAVKDGMQPKRLKKGKAPSVVYDDDRRVLAEAVVMHAPDKDNPRVEVKVIPQLLDVVSAVEDAFQLGVSE